MQGTYYTVGLSNDLELTAMNNRIIRVKANPDTDGITKSILFGFLKHGLYSNGTHDLLSRQKTQKFSTFFFYKIFNSLDMFCWIMIQLTIVEDVLLVESVIWKI